MKTTLSDVSKARRKKDDQPLIRFSVTFSSDDGTPHYTSHGWLYSPTGTVSPPRGFSGKRYNRASDELMDACRNYLATLKEVAEYFDGWEDKRGENNLGVPEFEMIVQGGTDDES